jgi:hypothetical protein
VWEKQREIERERRVKTDTGISVAALQDMQLTFVQKENIFNI